MDQQESFDEAIRRVRYHLTFGRTSEPRSFTREGIKGPPVPNAARPGEEFPGEWIQFPDDPLEGMTTDDWLAHFLSVAVNDAVHEVLEYFQVDGKCYLNPHGEQAEWIFVLVNEMAANLADLAKGDEGSK